MQVSAAAPAVESAVGKPWYVYLVRAANGSLYCRSDGSPRIRAARARAFFCSSPAMALVYIEQWPSKGEALRHERLIKKLRKSAKEALAASYAASPIHQRDAAPSG